MFIHDSLLSIVLPNTACCSWFYSNLCVWPLLFIQRNCWL